MLQRLLQEYENFNETNTNAIRPYQTYDVAKDKFLVLIIIISAVVCLILLVCIGICIFRCLKRFDSFPSMRRSRSQINGRIERNHILNYPAIKLKLFLKLVCMPTQVQCPICLDSFGIEQVNADNQRGNQIVEQLTQKKIYSQSEKSKKAFESVGEQYVRLTQCGHLYHNQCLSEWLVKQQVCPMCRQGLTIKNIESLQKKMGLKISPKKQVMNCNKIFNRQQTLAEMKFEEKIEGQMQREEILGQSLSMEEEKKNLWSSVTEEEKKSIHRFLKIFEYHKKIREGHESDNQQRIKKLHQKNLIGAERARDIKLQVQLQRLDLNKVKGRGAQSLNNSSPSNKKVANCPQNGNMAYQLQGLSQEIEIEIEERSVSQRCNDNEAQINIRELENEKGCCEVQLRQSRKIQKVEKRNHSFSNF